MLHKIATNYYSFTLHTQNLTKQSLTEHNKLFDMLDE